MPSKKKLKKEIERLREDNDSLYTKQIEMSDRLVTLALALRKAGVQEPGLKLVVTNEEPVWEVTPIVEAEYSVPQEEEARINEALANQYCEEAPVESQQDAGATTRYDWSKAEEDTPLYTFKEYKDLVAWYNKIIQELRKENAALKERLQLASSEGDRAFTYPNNA